MNEEARRTKKPVDYDQLYSGRFLKAGELLGKKVTLTISDVDLEMLMGEDGVEKAKAVISFKETEKKHIAPKTNGFCIKAMFGKTLSGWVGKRVTLFESTWNGEPCVRIWGSPDIPEEMQVEVALPRRRPFKMTMHRVALKGDDIGKTAEYLSAATGQALPPAQDPAHAAFFAEG